MPMTRTGLAPIIPAPAHEFSTLLTVLKQAQAINTQIVGPEKKTVISLDMGLYKPAKQLQMSREDLGHLVLRPGELHIVMAQLRVLGAAIEESGIDQLWIEADIFGSTTVKQILDAKHVRRAITAHVTSLQALFHLHQEVLVEKHPNIFSSLESAVNALSQAFKTGQEIEIKACHQTLVSAAEKLSLCEIATQFDKQNQEIPVFCFMVEYMLMVLNMLQFIRAVRTGNWDLHLKSLLTFT
jgi:ethanolamine utilization microcompartment shell protein EutS